MKHVTLEKGKWSYKATQSNIDAAKMQEQNQREIKNMHKEWAKKNIKKPVQ